MKELIEMKKELEKKLRLINRKIKQERLSTITYQDKEHIKLLAKSAKKYNTTVEKMICGYRNPEVVKAKTDFVKEMREIGYCLEYIANILGVHHSSIIYLLNK